MTEICRPAKCIEAIRVALLDQCTLEPVPGPMNGYAMGCIIEPNWTPEIEEGEESIVKDNCGNICLRDDRCDLTKRWNLEFKIKDPDKEFLALIEGNPLIVDGEGVSIGVRQLAYGSCSPYVWLEMFERTDDCDTEGDPIYLRHVFGAVRLKWTANEREGVFRILQIEGKTRDVVTDDIGIGPFEDIPAGLIVGTSPSERVDYVWFEDDFVPAIQCGAIEVPEPGVPQDVMLIGAQKVNDEIGSIWQTDSSGGNQVELVSDPITAPAAIGIAPDRLTFMAITNSGAGDQWKQYSKLGAPLVVGTAAPYASDVYIASQYPDASEAVYARVFGPDFGIERETLGGVKTTVETIVGSNLTSPAVSPDGTMVGFIKNTAGVYTVRVVTLAGAFVSESADLTLISGAPGPSVIWSSDSASLFVVAQNAQAGSDRELIKVTAATGAFVSLATVPSVSGVAVRGWDVLPDDSFIVFMRSNGAGGTDVYKVPTSGGALTLISTTPGGEPGDALSASPDGTKLALAYRGAGVVPNRVAVYDATAAVPTAPINTFALPGNPATDDLRVIVWRSQI